MHKILIIDDSDLVSKLLHDALTESGFETSRAVDANQGYTIALEFHPDLILLDVQLPDVTGFELCRVLKNREELHHIPIIMVTGSHHKTEDKVRGFQLGADDYVQKPFEMPELIERIRAVLRRTHKSNGTVSPAPSGTAAPKPAAPTVSDMSTPAPASPPPSIKVNLPAPASTPIKVPAAVPKIPSTTIQQATMGSLFNENLQPTVRKPVGYPKDVPPVSAPAPAPASPSTPASASPTSLKSVVLSILFDPLHFHEKMLDQSVGKPYMLLAIGLAIAGLVVSSGAETSPIVAGLFIAGIWGALLSVLVISSSILGITLGWREGAVILSLAGLPVLLKLLGGFILSLVTTLSPFYFTASPALFMNSGALWIRRFDLFEIWSAGLLFLLMRQRPNCDTRKARWITILIWAVAIALALAFEKWSVDV